MPRFVKACYHTRTILPATTTTERICADALVDAERRGLFHSGRRRSRRRGLSARVWRVRTRRRRSRSGRCGRGAPLWAMRALSRRSTVRRSVGPRRARSAGARPAGGVSRPAAGVLDRGTRRLLPPEGQPWSPPPKRGSCPTIPVARWRGSPRPAVEIPPAGRRGPPS